MKYFTINGRPACDFNMQMKKKSTKKSERIEQKNCSCNEEEAMINNHQQCL